jgi:hypothetical protein
MWMDARRFVLVVLGAAFGLSGPACELVGPDAPEDAKREDGQGGSASEFNPGWIGGQCERSADCAFDQATCLTDSEGFTEGHCTLECDRLCPDQEGAVVTFCTSRDELSLPGAGGLCIARCDYGLSPTGCRPGYQCVPVPRHNEEDTLVYACVPGHERGYEPEGCKAELADTGVGWSPAIVALDHPEGHPDLDCLVQEPVRLAPVVHGVTYRYDSVSGTPNPLLVSCELALRIVEMSALLEERGVRDVLHLGTYNCRTIAGTQKLSEHGRGTAIDVRGLRLDSGAVYTVEDDWEVGVQSPKTESGAFLRWAVEKFYAELLFNIILTPDYNDAHWNHFHMDLSEGERFFQ